MNNIVWNIFEFKLGGLYVFIIFWVVGCFGMFEKVVKDECIDMFEKVNKRCEYYFLCYVLLLIC